MKEQRLGIVASIAIHAGFLVLLLSIPVANAIPFTKTIYITFTQQEASLSATPKGMNAPAKPRTEEIRHINKPEVVEIKKPHDEFIINEKPATVEAQKAENLQPAKTEVASQGKAENQSIVETTFGNAGAPVFIHQEMPVYPYLARRLGKEGRVVLKLLIDKNGSVKNIEVTEPSGFGFIEAAVAAIKKSTFSPALRNGEKMVSKAILSFRFDLK